MKSTLKFVIQHADGRLLRKPRFPGDTVHWTQEEPISARAPWTFATRAGAEKTRDMVAHEATVETWEEPEPVKVELSGNVTLSPANVGRWRDCPRVVGMSPALAAPYEPVNSASQYNSDFDSYMLAAVLADLLIVSSDSGGC